MTQPTFNNDGLNYEQLLLRARESMAQTQALSSRLAMVNEIAALMNSTLDLEEILEIVCKQAQWLMEFQQCSVCLRRDAQWTLRMLGGTGDAQPLPDAEEDGSVGYTLRTGHPRLVLNAKNVGVFADYASQLIVPLKTEQEVIGTLNFVTTRQQAFTIEDLRIGYLLAFQLANAIRNSERFHELRQAQEALRQYSEELEVRNDELDAYSQIIAHDLKAPLNAIYGYASLLQMLSVEELDQFRDLYVSQIVRSTEQMNSMIDQLLWLAKTFDAPLVEVDMAALLGRTVARFAHQLTARDMRLDIAPDIPRALGHEAWIEEVFANLIGNAIKYMSGDVDPFIAIRGRCEGAFNRFEVEDNGIGIDPEALKSVFQMFTRFSHGVHEGHGLGLSIVSRLVTRMGGAVGVESTPRVGSTFWFTLAAP
jgi:signal transduction histidine kinase